ncbi:DUF4331 family protein [Nevskia soli]|uniref:DUF4331 family protein n=1 Tax=Nevskia soli TaxID=418856 RepID=UPI00068D43D1|nr:DUF4331 family protein [Nevskia soli]
MKHSSIPSGAVLALAFAALSACGGGGGGGSGSSNSNPQNFVFSTAPVTSYARVDRMGSPVTATVLITPAHKDMFNATDPINDGDYAAEETNTVKVLHYQLDPQLKAAGLASCARTCDSFATCDVSRCISQAVPLIIPDMLHLDLGQPDGFPNGRNFSDSVVDRVVAVALLDISTPGQCNGAPCTVDTLVNLPLDPTANDKPLPAEFPYLAAPFPPP